MRLREVTMCSKCVQNAFSVCFHHRTSLRRKAASSGGAGMLMWGTQMWERRPSNTHTTWARWAEGQNVVHPELEQLVVHPSIEHLKVIEP